MLCFTLYLWFLHLCFLHICKVGGLCMPTNECSKAGELLAAGPLSNSSPTIITHIQHILRQANQGVRMKISQTLPAIVLLLFQLSWDLSEDRFPDISPQSL